MFSVVLFNIIVNYLGKDVNSTFIKLVEEAREAFLGWGRGQYKRNLHAQQQKSVNDLIKISSCPGSVYGGQSTAQAPGLKDE